MMAEEENRRTWAISKGIFDLDNPEEWTRQIPGEKMKGFICLFHLTVLMSSSFPPYSQLPFSMPFTIEP